MTTEQRLPLDAEPGAEIVRLAADNAALDARLARLEGMMRGLREPAPCLPGIGSLRSDEAGAEPEIAGLRAELAARERRLAEAEAAARDRIAELSEALVAIERSIAWRATAPLRATAAALPPSVRNGLFQLARGVYHALTPHRMASRRHYRSYAPLLRSSVKRLESLSAEVRGRVGAPLRRAYGPTPVEQLDIYRTDRANAPLFVFVHGGAWREGDAQNYAFPAEMFVNSGAHFVALDFIAIREAGGDLRVMAEQVRRAIAWVYRNADSFGGDGSRLYVGGHSSGGHLCAVALTTDWPGEFGLPAALVQGGLLMSGVFDMQPVRQAKRDAYLRFTDEIEQAMSPQRHTALLHAPVAITCGGDETPEFLRQSREFCAAVKAAGKPAELIEAVNFNHMEMLESLANPYGPNGRAALALMRLAPTKGVAEVPNSLSEF
jgi:arylformamidase